MTVLSGAGTLPLLPAALLLLAVLLLVAFVALLLIPLRLSLGVRGDSRAGFAVALRLRVLAVRVLDRSLRAAPGAAVPAPATHDAGVAGRHGAAYAGKGEPGDAPAPPPAERPPTTRDVARQSLRDRLRGRVARPDVLLRLLRQHAVRVERPRGWIEFALADPAETGVVFGTTCALAALADPRGAVAIAPLWTCEDFAAADLSLDARVYPLRVLRVVVPVALHAPADGPNETPERAASRDAA